MQGDAFPMKQLATLDLRLAGSAAKLRLDEGTPPMLGRPQPTDRDENARDDLQPTGSGLVKECNVVLVS
jgi:hypothetical protein